MPRIVQNFLERGTGIAELPLQRACTDVQQFSDVLLRRFTFLQLLLQHLAYAGLDVVAFHPHEILIGDGIVVPSQLRIAAVQPLLDARAIEDQPIVLGIEPQRGPQQHLKILDHGRSRPSQFDQERRVLPPCQRAAHPKKCGDQGVDRLDRYIRGGFYEEMILGATLVKSVLHGVADQVAVSLNTFEGLLQCRAGA